MTADNSGKKQGGGRFQKGQSGNPRGKPKGARHKTTLLAERLMQDDVKAIVAAVLTAAKDGDMTAAKLVLERIAPARKDSPIAFDLPKIERPADAVAASAAILAAVAAGDLTPSEADGVLRLLGEHVKLIEVTELEERLKRLEARAGI